MKTARKIKTILVLFTALCASTSAFAAPQAADKDSPESHLHVTPGSPAAPVGGEEAPDFSDRLSGDWMGYRTKLYYRGLDFTVAYTGDYLNNIDGGIKKGDGYLDNLDLQLAIDGSKLYGVDGQKIFIYFLNNNGSAFNRGRVGSGEGVDSIEVGEPTFKLYEAWIEQAFLNDKMSLRAGLYDLNSEFDVTDSSGVFVHPTFGLDTAFAVTGQNGPSAFPTTSAAVRLKYQPNAKMYAQLAVLDGVPGSVNNAEGTHVHIKEEDGALTVAELGFGELESGRVGVGGWWYSKRFDKLDPATDRDYGDGIYGFAEKTLYSPDSDGKRHLDAFIRAAGTSGTVSQYDYSWSAGVAYTGMFESRAEDIAGLAFHGAHNSDPYLRANAGSDDAEFGIEATYAAQITPWLNIQPDVQYVHNPGTTGTINDDAWIAGARLGINL